MKLYADFQRWNFFRSPHWRWDRVLKMADRHPTPGRCTRADDAYVKEARSFYLRWRDQETEEARESLWWENHGLYYALDLFRRSLDDPELSMFVEARLLARQTPEQISEVYSLHPDCVRWYERLFFDIIDKIEQRDWITKQIILPALAKQPPVLDKNGLPPTFRDRSVIKPFMDGSLKLFAYFGGPHLVDYMLSNLRAGKPLISPDETDNWLDSTMATTVRRRSTQAAMMCEVNNFNVMELLTVHTRIIELERSDESREVQRTTWERHTKALIDEIPFMAGADGARHLEGTVLGNYDQGAVELRDAEIIDVTSEAKKPNLDDFPKRLPAPRPKNSTLTNNQGTIL